jgi:LmbE family N-acetylglucosaminyl deacetylase
MDFTHGELGTRGTEIRLAESMEATKILGITLVRIWVLEMVFR